MLSAIKNLSWQSLMLLSFMLPLAACTSTDTNSTELVEITNHWVKATHPGQSVSAAYMTLTSNQKVSLTHVSSDISPAVEIHEMGMHNGIMRMRQLNALPLKKGEPTSLKPGGFHLMLFDIQEPLKEGDIVNFELCFEDKAGKITTLPLKSVVKAANSDHHH